MTSISRCSVSPITGFIVKVAARCNLNCSYCFEFNLGDESWRRMPSVMSRATVETLVRRLREQTDAQDQRWIQVILHGGEPMLLGKARTREFIHSIRNGLPKVEVEFGMQTNAVLIDAEWVELFTDLGLRVSLSLDGSEEINDKFRVDHRGGGSHARAVAGIRKLTETEAGRKLFGGVLAVINPEADPMEAYSALRGLEPPMLEFLMPHHNWDRPPPWKGPDPMRTTPVADWLIPIFDQWFRFDAAKVRIRLFEELMARLVGLRSRVENVGVGRIGLIVVATNGDIEAVDTLKSIPGEQILGMNLERHSFADAMTHPKYVLRQRGLRQLGSECQKCSYGEICGGGYIPHRWSSKRGFKNPSVYCADLAKLIGHIQARMWEQVRSERDPLSLPN